MKWLQKLKSGLSKTSNGISLSIKNAIVNRKLDNHKIQEIEDSLIMADIGIDISAKITHEIAAHKFAKDVTEDEVKTLISQQLCKPLAAINHQLVINPGLNVILFCGVNGNGKTTTIGKLAAKYHKAGKKILVAACDTFRAAAEEQLYVWVKRGAVDFFTGTPNQDPASIAFQACDKAQKENYDILFIDTAGRLQNKLNLMEALEKIVRVIKKVSPDFPQHSIIVIDATTGSNAIDQIKVFSEKILITGVIITKLDGTAKGGIAIAIAKNFNLPIHAVGVGEGVEDLNDFSPEEFSKALIGAS